MTTITLPNCPICGNDITVLQSFSDAEKVLSSSAATAPYRSVRFKCGAEACQGTVDTDFVWTRGCPNAMPTTEKP